MAPTDWQLELRTNIARVRQSIAVACRKAHRNPADVRLVAVTKYVSTDVLRAVMAAGIVDIGESHAQQLVARARECGAAQLDWPGDATPAPQPPEQLSTPPRWHMIGHLQRNKVKMLLPHARVIHSLDSARLAEALEQQAAQLAALVDVFIEVNVAGEAAKTGAAIDAVPALLQVVAACPHLILRGLMTMAPYDPDPETARPHFARLRQFLAQLRDTGAVGPACVHLSMGMSHDYTIAVEEGATLVRVGSALFEGLPSGDPRTE